MAPTLEGYDQATVIPQCMINRLISQHASLAAPDELHFEDEHGSGLSDVVAGIPQVILDVDRGDIDHVLLVLPLLSAQLRIRANANPEDHTAIEFVVKDWQLAFPVHVDATPETTPDPKYKQTQKSLKLQKEYTMVHNSLKSESGITIWDWLMRLGGSKFDPIDTRFSFFGHWSDQDFFISEDETYVPATHRFAVGSERHFSAEFEWFNRFTEYLDQFGRHIWQTITLGIFQHVATKPIMNNSQKPASPVTGLHIQQYPYLDNSMYFRTGTDRQSRFNAICFLETFQGRSLPQTRALPWQGNWIEGEYGLHQFTLFPLILPDLSRWAYILLQAQQQTTPIAVEWGPQDLPSWCQFVRYQGNETDSIKAMLKDHNPEEAELWNYTGTGLSPRNFSPLPSNALVWACDSPAGNGFSTKYQSHTGYLTLIARLSSVPGSNQMHMDTRMMKRFKSTTSTSWQVKSWGRVELHFFDGQDGLSIKVLCSDLHDADKFTLDMSVPLNDEQIAKANEELDKLRAKIEDVRPASFSLGGPVLSRHGPLPAAQYLDTESTERVYRLTYPHASLSVCHIPNAGPHNIPPNATIAAASRDPNTIEIWWVATDGSVQGAYFYEGATWQRYTLAGPGSAVSNTVCATSCDPLRMDVFWIAPDGSIQGCDFQRRRDSSWGSPRTIHGGHSALISGRIEAVTWNPGRVAVFWTQANGDIEGSFATKDGEWVSRTAMSATGGSPTNDFKALGSPSGNGFDLVKVCSKDEIRTVSPRWQPTADLPESFMADITSSSSAISRPSLLAIGDYGDGHFAYWHATPSGGIVGAQKSPGGQWKRGDVAPDGSIAAGGSLQAASHAPDKTDLLWFSPTGVLMGCSSTVDKLSTTSHALRDDPVAAPESPLTVTCRQQGTLDVFFLSPSGHLVAGIVKCE